MYEFRGDVAVVTGAAQGNGRAIALGLARAGARVACCDVQIEPLHGLVEEIERLKANTGVERVAEFIMSLCPAHGGECEIQLPYDKALIAARLGMKPETLSRAFARLRDVGVNMGDGTAVIADVGRLRHYVLAGEGPIEGA